MYTYIYTHNTHTQHTLIYIHTFIHTRTSMCVCVCGINNTCVDLHIFKRIRKNCKCAIYARTHLFECVRTIHIYAWYLTECVRVQAELT